MNTIAEIVHYVVDKYDGKSNKNLGDAFLLVWKFRDEDIDNIINYDDDGNEKIDIALKNYTNENNAITARCEMAVLSYLETIITI